MKLWGGRFAKGIAPEVLDFHSSLRFDRRLYRHDIRGSIAHARMLGRVGLISPAEAEAIVAGLEGILADLEAGRLELDPMAEDIHSEVERILTERIGPAGQKLHTGRSRNDQVALDLRLYLKEEIAALDGSLAGLQQALLDLVEQHLDTILPGYTHLQRAQPVTLAHHLLAYWEMLHRDRGRLADCVQRFDLSPLGAGALAGTTLPLDRAAVARELGLAGTCANSLDAVSDRDFAVEFLAAASLIMTHLSRLAEEVVLWSSSEFGFIELDDAYSTGSSMMPQKKNPDVAELARGKTGRVYGHLLALLTVLKGLPLSYNKDLQEDKEAVFDTVDTLKGCLAAFTPMLATARFNQARMLAAAGGFSIATDLAEYLVLKGVPFRAAHAVVGQLVRSCLERGKDLPDLTLAELQSFSPAFGADALGWLTPAASLSKRGLPGGPGRAAVTAALARARQEMAARK